MDVSEMLKIVTEIIHKSNEKEMIEETKTTFMRA